MTTLRPPRRVLRALAAPALWLERTRGRKRLLLLVAYGLVSLIPLAFVVRAFSLAGLPDIGDPFDVAAHRASAVVPEAEDARPLYERAYAIAPSIEVLHDWLALRQGSRFRAGGPGSGPIFTRGAGDLGLLRTRCGPALSSWKEATRRPRLSIPVGWGRPEPAGPSWPGYRYDIDPSLRDLAAEEALDCEARLDWAEAWEWHRALLRHSRHVAADGDFSSRWLARSLHQLACEGAERWAADPLADAPLLRRALADAIEVGRMTPPDSDAYKHAFFSTLAQLDPPSDALRRSVEQDFVGSDVSEWMFYRQLPGYGSLRWFLSHEPERGRRIVRLTFANWLAHVDDPPGRRPAMGPAPPGLFPIGPGDPPSARAAQTKTLTRAFAEPGTARRVLVSYEDLQRSLDQERARQAQLVVTLATELYRRERKAAPPSPAALVGPYLDALPEGYVEPKASR